MLREHLIAALLVPLFLIANFTQQEKEQSNFGTFFLLKTGSCYIVQASLKLAILPLHLKYWIIGMNDHIWN